jgi:hypothetical protein
MLNSQFYGRSNELVVSGCLTNALINVRGPINRNNWTRENFDYDGTVNFTNSLYAGNLTVNTNARVQAYMTVGSTNQVEADYGAVRTDASEIMLQVPDRKWYLQVIDSTAGGDSSVLFRNMTASRDVLRIFPGGNVNIQDGFLGIGIGTNAPGNAIDIAITNAAAIALESTGPGGVEWYLQTGNTASGLGGAFRLYNNSIGATPFQITGFGDATFLGNIRSSGGTIAGKDGFLIKTTDYPVTTSDAGYTFSNEGAAGLVTMTLPTPAAGLRYTFYVRNAVGFKVATAAVGQTIRIAGSISTSGGYIDDSTVGDSVTIIALNSTEWGATSIVGAGWSAH